MYSKMHHVPDMILTLPNGSKIFVEIEMQKNRKLDTRIFLINSQRQSRTSFVRAAEKEAVSSLAYFVPNADNVRLSTLTPLSRTYGKRAKSGKATT